MSDLPKYTVLVSPGARDMLFEHARFLANVSIEAAKILFDHFEEKVDSLETMPERFPYYDNPYIKFGKYRRATLWKYLIILYQVKGSIVYIDSIDVRAENKSLPNNESPYDRG